MQYRIQRRNDDLEHSLFSKAGAKLGSTWEKHKYIAKQKVGDGYRYFYSQAELAAANAKKVGQKVTNATKDAVSNASYTARRVTNKIGSTVKKGTDIISGKYARDVRDNIRRAQENFDNEIDQGYATLHRRSYANQTNWDKVDAALDRRQAAIDAALKTTQKSYEPTKTLAFKISKEIALRQDILNYYIRKGKKSVSDFFNSAKGQAIQMASSVSDSVKTLANKGKAVVDNFINKGPKQSKNNRPIKTNAGKTIAEQIITEDVIYPDMIYEEIIEDIPHLKSSKHKK